MNGYNLVLNKLIAALDGSPFVNVVTDGLGDEIDLSKQTIFPLSHITINGFTPKENIIEYTVDIYCLDIVDISDDGTNNKDDVMNTQGDVVLRLYESLRRGDLWGDGLEIGSINSDAVYRAYENFLSGWKVTLTILIPNHMSIC